MNEMSWDDYNGLSNSYAGSDDLFADNSGQDMSCSSSKLVYNTHDNPLNSDSRGATGAQMPGIRNSNVYFRPVSPDSIGMECKSANSSAQITYESRELPKNSEENVSFKTNASVIPRDSEHTTVVIGDSDKSSSGILDLSLETSGTCKSNNFDVLNSVKKRVIRNWLDNVSLNSTAKPKNVSNLTANYQPNTINKLSLDQVSPSVLNHVNTSDVNVHINKSIVSEMDVSTISSLNVSEKKLENRKLSINNNIGNIQEDEEREKSIKVLGAYNLRRNRRQGKENLQNNNISSIPLSTQKQPATSFFDPKSQSVCVKNPPRSVCANEIKSHIKRKISYRQKKKVKRESGKSGDDEEYISNILNSVLSIKSNSDEDSFSSARRKGYDRRVNSGDNDNELNNVSCQSNNLFTPRRKLFFRNALNNSLDDENEFLEEPNNCPPLTNHAVTSTPLPKSSRLKGLNAILSHTLNVSNQNVTCSDNMTNNLQHGVKDPSNKQIEEITEQNVKHFDEEENLAQDSPDNSMKCSQSDKYCRNFSDDISDEKTSSNSNANDSNKLLPVDEEDNSKFQEPCLKNTSTELKVLDANRPKESLSSPQVCLTDSSYAASDDNGAENESFSMRRAGRKIKKLNFSDSDEESGQDIHMEVMGSKHFTLEETPIVKKLGDSKHKDVQTHPLFGENEEHETAVEVAMNSSDGFVKKCQENISEEHYLNSGSKYNNNFDNLKDSNILLNNEPKIQSEHNENKNECKEQNIQVASLTAIFEESIASIDSILSINNLKDSKMLENCEGSIVEPEGKHLSLIKESSTKSFVPENSYNNYDSRQEGKISNDLGSSKDNYEDKETEINMSLSVHHENSLENDFCSKFPIQTQDNDKINDSSTSHNISSNFEEELLGEEDEGNQMEKSDDISLKNGNFSSESNRKFSNVYSPMVSPVNGFNSIRQDENSDKKSVNSSARTSSRMDQNLGKEDESNQMKKSNDVSLKNEKLSSESNRKFSNVYSPMVSPVNGFNSVRQDENSDKKSFNSSAQASSRMDQNLSVIVLSDSEDSFIKVCRSKTPLKKNRLNYSNEDVEMIDLVTDDILEKDYKRPRKQHSQDKYNPEQLIIRENDSSFSSDDKDTEICHEIINSSAADSQDSSSSECDAEETPWVDLATYLKKHVPAMSIPYDNSTTAAKKRTLLDITLPDHSSSPDHTSFLLSLTGSVPEDMCHPEAVKYRESFETHKNTLVDLLFKLYNQEIFDNKLPPIEIKWSGHLTTTSGITKSSSRITKTGKVRISVIKLSKTVVNDASKLRDVLIHELCHAANWLIDEQAGGHGPLFKKWANKVWYRFPEMPKVRVCHRYELKWKYIYKCTYCGYELGKMKLNVKEDSCRLCGGRVVVNP